MATTSTDAESTTARGAKEKLPIAIRISIRDIKETNKYAPNVYPIYFDKSTAKWH